MNDLHIALAAVQMASWERRKRERDAAAPPPGPRRFWPRLGGVVAVLLLVALYVAVSLSRAW